MRWVLHVDLDQFIAAVEVLRRPELRGRPVVVGGDGDPTKRGVVATASYEAREYGVHSGQPLRTAARKLPDTAVFLPVDFAAYEEVSAVVMDVLRDTGAVVEVLGWDEAFLGVETSDPESFARDVRERVLAATELSCSVGIGDNKLQAKLATGFGKPAGVFRLTSATWFSVMGSLPTDALWGIGVKTAKKLAGLGISTVAELAAADPDELAAVFGPTTGPWLVILGRGIGDSEVDASPYVARGHGKEETFQSNIASWSVVESEVVRIARLLAEDLASESRPVVRVVVKVRYAPFITETHGVALKKTAEQDMTLEEAALAALARFTGRRPVRLLGVRAEFESVDALERAGHGDLGQGRVGWQRLALAGGDEAAAFVEPDGGLVVLSDPQVQGDGVRDRCGPVRHGVDQGLADTMPASLRPDPHRDQLDDARFLLVAARQPDGVCPAPVEVGQEGAVASDPAQPLFPGERRLLGVCRPERVRRVTQRREPDVTQVLPVLGSRRSHQDHDTWLRHAGVAGNLFPVACLRCPRFALPCVALPCRDAEVPGAEVPRCRLDKPGHSRGFWAPRDVTQCRVAS
ncbi:MAG: DNA polymerase IV [Streptosporangiaceae bacterium]|nr:DNA polymerase IV [Streptosporangiaceae bacterium]